MTLNEPGDHHRRALVFGYAVAGALCVLTQPLPAIAQNRDATVIAPPPRPAEVQPRRSGAPPLLRPTTTDDDLFNSLRRERPARPAADGGTDASDVEDDANDEDLGSGDPALRPSQDGVLSEPVPTVLVDGPRPDVIEAQGAIDGLDPAENDQRDPADAAVFEQPPAGFDPQLFQVEVEPILDRRPARLFRFEPFDPLGIKVGSFVLLPELETAALWNSNVLRSSRARSDVAIDVRPSARLVSNWRRHAVEFRARGGLSFFQELASEDDRTYQLEARGRLDISRRTRIEQLVSRDVSQERRSSIDAQVGAASRAEIATDRYAVAVEHRFNRLSVQLRGAFADTTFGATRDAVTGVVATNRERSGTVTEEAARATWEFKPTLLGFLEVGLNQRDFRAVAISDGITRNSTGERYRVGVGFGQTGERLRGEASIGYGRQRPDDRRLETVDGVVLDANLAYRLNGLTSLLLTARSDLGDTTLAGSAGSISRQVGIEARHAFLRQLIGNAGVSYTVADFAGVALEERELTGTLGLEYFLDRETVLFGRYQHTNFDSTELGRDYKVDEVRLGIRLRR